MQRNRRVPFAIWVTLWAIIVIAALALIITPPDGPLAKW
jgi:hypothetical protein